MFMSCVLIVPVGSHIPFSLSQLADMVLVLRDIFISLHMEKHLPPSYSYTGGRVMAYTAKPHPQVCPSACLSTISQSVCPPSVSLSVRPPLVCHFILRNG